VKGLKVQEETKVKREKKATGDAGSLDLLNANFRGNMSLQGIDSLDVSDGSRKLSQLTMVQTDLQDGVPDNYEAARDKYSAIALIVPQWKSQQTLLGGQLVMNLKEKAVIAVGKKAGVGVINTGTKVRTNQLSHCVSFIR